jgi:hypothetical protein
MTCVWLVANKLLVCSCVRMCTRAHACVCVHVLWTKVHCHVACCACPCALASSTLHGKRGRYEQVERVCRVPRWIFRFFITNLNVVRKLKSSATKVENICDFLAFAILGFDHYARRFLVANNRKDACNQAREVIKTGGGDKSLMQERRCECE